MTSSNGSEHKIHWTSTDLMRPTQCAVGYLEVDFKMQELRARATRLEALERYLKGRPLPAVRGPDGRMYLTDHHHMGLALMRLAEEWDASDRFAAANPFRQCAFQLVKDWSEHLDMSMAQFFARLEAQQLCHPFDGHGRRVGTIPRSLLDLVDDPYRSLAGLARKAGAYTKVDVAFTEFRWADFLRDKVDVGLICPAHLAQAIFQTVQLAHQPQAAHLPGYLGPKAVYQLPTLEVIRARLSQRYGAEDDAPDLPVIAGLA